MKLLGYLLVIVGFLSAAFLSSLDPELVNWTLFIPAIIVGAAGVLSVRIAKKRAAGDSTVLNEAKTTLTESLNNIVVNLGALRADPSQLPSHDLRFEIDATFREDLRNFADARESMKPLYGLKAYAEVMSAFAAGERYLNRIWSASVDGYADEAIAYLDRAATQFDDAQAKLRRVMAGPTS